MVKKYADLYLEARRALRDSYGDQAGSVARQLLSSASGKTPEAIIADCDIYASEAVGDQMESYLARALGGEPLAYILGQWDFAGMTLTVTPDTLIPRDDTMAVTELAIKTALHLHAEPRILDLCTGTGCIGLAVARRVKDARVVLGDVSPAAVRVAKKNTQDLHLGGRVTCLQIDVRRPASAFLGKFDMITANPPYVTDAEMDALPPEVAEHEPELALRGGPDGLDLYRAIFENYTDALQPGGFVCLEFGKGQQDAVCALLREHGYEVVTTREDYRKVIRAVLARKK